MESNKANRKWTETEIQASVDAYLDMLQREQAGQEISKAHERRILLEGPLAGRNDGAVEYRMQNISAVLEQMGRQRIIGYKPAGHAGANVERIIRERLDAWDNKPTSQDFEPTADDATLEKRALKLEKQPITTPPKGVARPQQSTSSGKTFFRDPEVRAWVRQQANGVCEGCGAAAPFLKDGQPFLEVHHVKHLADEGSDRITNAVALCPNCHRRCHHSSDKDAYTASLYEKVARLVRED
ncbi:HNH endonuclease [Pseudomonas sp. NPDC090202]|uniref:HNH endonuclease n=1 Tax=unclassified Pseudomonas TaxID=196821 RepID=UPI0038151666